MQHEDPGTKGTWILLDAHLWNQKTEKEREQPRWVSLKEHENHIQLLTMEPQ